MRKYDYYDYIEDPLVRESLEQYKDKVDQAKSHRLDISSYIVKKPWGFEKWLEINEYYTYKLISMKKGCRSSLQSHEKKVETNYVISGVAEVLLENEKGEMESHVYKTGEGWSIPLNTKHRVIAKEDYVAVECSTSHLTDVIRYEDDTNRGNGEIKSEHK